MPDRLQRTSRDTMRSPRATPAGGTPAAGTGLILEHGTLGARLARYAVAEAYDAVHEPTGAPRHVYVLRAGAMRDQPLVHRVVCEADAAHWLRHPAAARIAGYGHTPNGRLYVAVDATPGRTLADVLSTTGRLPAARVVRMACQLVEALAEAHAVGLVHGHLTPSAIVVGDAEETAGQPPLTLTGLGTAWLALARDVAPDDRLYLSPERLTGAEPDARSDVYGLAAVLRHALVGPPASEHGAAPSAPADAVLSAACSVDPARRHPSVKAFWEDLLAALVGGGADVVLAEPAATSLVEERPADIATAAPATTDHALGFDAVDLAGFDLQADLPPVVPRAMAADGVAVAPSAAAPGRGPLSSRLDLWALPHTGEPIRTLPRAQARPALPSGRSRPSHSGERSSWREHPARGSGRDRERPRGAPVRVVPPPPRRTRRFAIRALLLAIPAVAAALSWPIPDGGPARDQGGDVEAIETAPVTPPPRRKARRAATERPAGPSVEQRADSPAEHPVRRDTADAASEEAPRDTLPGSPGSTAPGSAAPESLVVWTPRPSTSEAPAAEPSTVASPAAAHERADSLGAAARRATAAPLDPGRTPPGGRPASAPGTAPGSSARPE